jgi:RNA polymerase sigma-70 factor (ECF subfamily)
MAPPFARSGSVPWQEVVDSVTGLEPEGRALARGGRPVNADARLASAGRWKGACDTLDAPPSGHQPVSRMIGPPHGSDKRMSADAEADARADFDASLVELRADLLAYLRRRLGDRETAADLTQEAVLRMMKYRDTTQVKDRRGMLFRIAHRLVLDHRRTQYRRHAARHVSLDDVGELSMDQGSVEAIVDARQAMHRLLTRVTDDLPPKCRLAFVMSRFEGLTNKQVAAKMGISEKMVEKYITRALVACRLAVGERGA